MPRFNPFHHVDGSRGAPMGRHCGGDGYYDRGGAYWGHSKVCAVWTRGGAWCAYVEAYTPAAAIRLVTQEA